MVAVKRRLAWLLNTLLREDRLWQAEPPCTALQDAAWRPSAYGLGLQLAVRLELPEHRLPQAFVRVENKGRRQTDPPRMLLETVKLGQERSPQTNSVGPIERTLPRTPQL